MHVLNDHEGSPQVFKVQVLFSTNDFKILKIDVFNVTDSLKTATNNIVRKSAHPKIEIG